MPGDVVFLVGASLLLPPPPPRRKYWTDEELEELRKQRLAELQAKHGDPGDAAHQKAKQRKAEMRNSILAHVLDQSAQARLSNLALVKPEKTKAVENYLIQMARYGQLSGKVSEQGLIEILEKVSQQTEKKTTVKFNRRKVMDSDHRPKMLMYASYNPGLRLLWFHLLPFSAFPVGSCAPFTQA
ncbi:programmed cell death protein 5-like [Microtus oregoni]|uniref:programmed cell death protein 5-like n=1 Tax=Microtus oregoni TaxID=111838 RepID=UPI001BB208A8|nr:programmed cell death protein 5-like [Microtus oregoni]